nr:MAG TPA: putative homeodomain transcription factor [Caudoviricetes sp.]
MITDSSITKTEPESPKSKPDRRFLVRIFFF